MSSLIFVSIQGKKNGFISAGCGTVQSIGNKYIAGHEDEIFAYSFQHLLTRQQHANHHPVQFIKPIDKCSPILGACLSENEELEVFLNFYRTGVKGGIEHNYKIRLSKAFISSIKYDYPHSVNSNGMTPQEVISLVYQDITWENIGCSTSSYSIWEERIS